MSKLFLDKPRYFEIQYLNSKDSIIPFLKGFFTPSEGKYVLEIGSSEGGVLKAFTECNCVCTGIELEDNRVDLANKFMADEIKDGFVNFINKNIYDINPEKLPSKFDLIILKDVIEHIHNQEKFMAMIGSFLKPDGLIFFGFPAWRMPFGGHQQACNSKVLSKLPYFHLLPKPLYRGMFKLFGETKEITENLIEIKDTQISTKRFERLCKENNFKIEKQIKYLVAPIYEHKFGYKTKILPKWIGAIPFFNDFLTFQSYYVIKKIR
jgi:2-polyprenyl-3-methyl-5-hydroxy-6-metoxy-1,4-benzoquinol methylase